MSAAAQLPREFRAAIWTALIASALVGFGSSAEAMTAFNPPDVEEVVRAMPKYGDPQVSEAITRTRLEMAQGMRGPRGAVLLALSFVCGLALVSAMRLLYPGGLPRSGMRRITAGALLVAGVLRTVDGAMELVIARRTAREIERLDLAAEIPGMDPERVLSSFLVLLTVALTLLMVGIFVGVSQYLRSERARKIVETVDAATSQGT